MKKNSGDIRGVLTLIVIVIVVAACVFGYSEYATRKRNADNKTEVILLKPETSGFTEYTVDSDDIDSLKSLVNKLKDSITKE
jgi:hypothetical protein